MHAVALRETQLSFPASAPSIRWRIVRGPFCLVGKRNDVCIDRKQSLTIDRPKKKSPSYECQEHRAQRNEKAGEIAKPEKTLQGFLMRQWYLVMKWRRWLSSEGRKDYPNLMKRRKWAIVGRGGSGEKGGRGRRIARRNKRRRLGATAEKGEGCTVKGAERRWKRREKEKRVKESEGAARVNSPYATIGKKRWDWSELETIRSVIPAIKFGGRREVQQRPKQARLATKLSRGLPRWRTDGHQAPDRAPPLHRVPHSPFQFHRPPSNTPRTSSTVIRSVRKGQRSVSSVSCGSLNHEETGTALFGWKIYDAGELSRMIVSSMGRPSRERS